MTRLTTIALVTAAVAALIGCARTGLPTATQADASRASTTWPEITVAELNRGRTLYNAHCSSCHLPVAPTDIPAAEWSRHVGEMKERAHLNDDAARAVERYLITMANRRAR